MGILWFVIGLMLLGAFIVAAYCVLRSETVKERLYTLLIYTVAILMIVAAIAKYQS